MAYLGSSRGLERDLVPRAGLPYFLLPMAAPTSPRGIALLVGAALRSVLVVRRLRPRVTFATGGYVSIPAVVASWLLRVPVIMFLPDVVPGRAVAWLLPLTRRIAVSTEDALRHLPATKTQVTGYPVREYFLHASRVQARRRFDLPPDATVLCVFGGSQGARAINQALAFSLRELLPHMHVVHICGDRRFDEARQAALFLSSEERSRYHLFPYLHDQDMADALAAADLTVCRSGASTIGELPFLGVPAILVPLPERKVHQHENAAYLERHGAAVVISDDALTGRLGPAVNDLLADRDRLAAMASAMRSLARPDAAERIAALIFEEAA